MWARIYLVPVLILAIVGLAAPIGYLTGTSNWSEYYSQEVNIGEKVNSGFVALAPMDSLRISVSFQEPADSPYLILLTADLFYNCQVPTCIALAKDVPMGPTSNLQIYYTSASGGTYAWIAIGMAGETTVPGVVTITISVLCLAFVPFVAILTLLIYPRHKKPRRTQLRKT